MNIDLDKRRTLLASKLVNPDALTDEVWEVWKRLNYRELRQYPSITDQLELQSDDKINGTELWIAAIQLVKAEFPKPLPTDAEAIGVLEFKIQPAPPKLVITKRPNKK